MVLNKETLEISSKETLLKNKEETRLKENWYLDKFWWKLKIVCINDNVFSVEWTSWNITYYIDGNGDRILSANNISKLSSIDNYYLKLSIKEKKDEQWVYHMYRIDAQWNKQEIDKYSEEYFNIWVDLSFLHWRDFVLKVFEWDTKKTTLKIEDKLLEMMIKDTSIRLVDLLILQQKWNITKEQFINYSKQLQWMLLSQIWDTRFWLLDNNSTITINNKYGNFHLDTSKVTISEIEFLYKLKIISGNIYKLAMEKLEELESLEEMKQIEINKQIWEDKKAIRNL